MRSLRLVPMAVAVSVVAAACAGYGALARPVVPDGEERARPPRAWVNTAPRLAAEVVVAAGPGLPTTATLPIADRENDAVVVEVSPTSGLTVQPSGDGSWRLEWSPTATGTLTARVTLTDEHGADRVEEVTLRSTNPLRADALLGMGDSVASGHGLQRRDYLGRDGCWRSEREAYPWHVREGLVDTGVLDGSGEYALVACSGATLGDLLDEPVTGGPGDAVPDGVSRRSQVGWAIAVNPGVITLTAGANTLRFTDPWNLLDDDLEVDEGELARRLRRVEADLDEVLGRLVDHTDSRVYLTNYYNPSANEPQGVDGCRGDCFRQRSQEVVDAFNASIARVAAGFPPDRVVLVDVADDFEGHGAPNGLGPDGLRSGATGWLRGLIGEPLAGVHPYCARGHDDAGSWINYVDCVHPDGRGHRQIAAAIVAAAAGAS